MWVFVAEDLMVLNEVNEIDLEPPERLLELSRRLLFRPAVDFRHEEYFVPVAVAESFPHASLAGAVVVIPTVIHEVDPAIYRGANDSDTELLIDMPQSEVPATDSNR
jgi:hypothetical protein